MSDHIEAEEVRRLTKAGYVIRMKWISPVEGYEYRLYRAGGNEVLAYRKTERAAYNAALKLIDKPDTGAKGGEG